MLQFPAPPVQDKHVENVMFVLDDLVLSSQLYLLSYTVLNHFLESVHCLAGNNVVICSRNLIVKSFGAMIQADLVKD